MNPLTCERYTLGGRFTGGISGCFNSCISRSISGCIKWLHQ